MTSFRLILREVLHRKLNFLVALLSAVVAVASLVGLVTVLQGYDLETDRLLSQKQADVETRGKELQDFYRKLTKKLGFNILILPEGQNLADVYAQGYAEKTMPEEYVRTLAASPLMKIDHLLPALERKVEWPEQKRSIVLIGIRGEVPIIQKKQKPPLLDPVKPGEIVLGYELHHQLGLDAGDELTLMGQKFTVAKHYARRGTKDDITAWIDLAEAQQLLGEPERINTIWALNCNCESKEALPEIQAEIAKVLPDVQVIEFASQLLVRAQTRNRAKQEAEQALAAAEQSRSEVRQKIESLAALAVPGVLFVCAIWIGLTALANVRDRRAEIGILRAIGVRSTQVLGIFLGKAAIVGLLGAVLGIALGASIGAFWYRGQTGVEQALLSSELFGPLNSTLLVVLIGAPVVAMLASWLPALAAAAQDPAEVLCEE